MELEKLRDQIDTIDHDIIELLAQRLQTVTQIGHYKQANNVTVRDDGRFEALVARLQDQGKDLGVSPELIARVYHEIHEDSIAHQQIKP